MPGMYARLGTNRRQFLSVAGGAAGFALLPKGTGAEESAPRSVRWALLADTHVAADRDEVYRGSLPFENLGTVASQVTASAPSAAIIVGDIARLDGQLGDYRMVRRLLEPLAAEAIPVFMGLGNHDDRANFLEVFDQSDDSGTRQQVSQKHVLVVDQSPVVRVVLLDSLDRVNEAAGALGNAQVQWLEGYLEDAGDVPVVICVHHTLGNGGGDLQDVDELFQIIERVPAVKAICYGHSHRFAYAERDGVHLINMPPIGYRFDDITPLGWLEGEFTRQGASLKLRTVTTGAKGDGTAKSITWR